MTTREEKAVNAVLKKVVAFQPRQRLAVIEYILSKYCQECGLPVTECDCYELENFERVEPER